ncbi:MAG: hypothetical protein JSS53_10125, partial [Proteobacteria bacterium]|nr:hypothetical protein [Pseudomonadota bacterium]
MKINRYNFICTIGLFFVASMMLTSCAKIAVMVTPEKKAEPSKTELAKIAKDHFWKTLHDGHYNDLPETTRLLTAAYLQNPNDPDLAGFLGFAHIWKIAERSRQTELQPTIINHSVLARRFF